MCLVRRGGLHSSAFEEVRDYLVHAIRRGGGTVSSADDVLHVEGARTIVLGAHGLPESELVSLPPGTIVYNLEQIDPQSQLPPGHLPRYRSCTVWDHSCMNQARWREAGVGATVVPLAYVPELGRIASVPRPSIDVLFYGSMNERRQRIIDRLRERGLDVRTAYGLYGTDRDQAIAHSKLVLNVHYYDAQILETVRLFYLLANGKAVVSERGERTVVPPTYERGVAFATYDALVSRCVELVRETSLRTRLEREALAAIQQLDGAEIIAKALASTPVVTASLSPPAG